MAAANTQRSTMKSEAVSAPTTRGVMPKSKHSCKKSRYLHRGSYSAMNARNSAQGSGCTRTACVRWPPCNPPTAAVRARWSGAARACHHRRSPRRSDKRAVAGRLHTSPAWPAPPRHSTGEMQGHPAPGPRCPGLLPSGCGHWEGEKRKRRKGARHHRRKSHAQSLPLSLSLSFVISLVLPLAFSLHTCTRTPPKEAGHVRERSQWGREGG